MSKEKQYDEDTGFHYYNELPDGWKTATLADFIDRHKRLKLNMEYLILGYNWKVYQLHKVNERLKSAFLIEFINDNRVFIKK